MRCSHYLYAMFARQLILIFLFIIASHKDWATNYIYDYNDNCSKAYHAYLSLHIKEARASLATEQRSNPQNLMVTYISDYEDCILLLLNCDETEYKQRADHLNEHIEQLDKGDKSSPWYRFCKAGVYLRWAIINVRFGEQYSAALNFHHSFALLRENRRLFPAFEYNNTFAGLEEAVVGSLPGSYKWLASIFGMKGNVRKGTQQLADFVSTHTSRDLMYSETVLYYLYTRFYLLQEQKEAWNYLNSDQFSTTNNLLNTYVKTNLALDYRKSDEAIETLHAAAGDADFDRYPIFDYQAGVALLTKSDTACVSYFHAYLKKNKSDLYIKDCWQKMAFASYISGNTQQAEYCKQQIKLHGTARIDADKQAEKFANSPAWPLKKLLQARLLIEGGYYSQAFTILNSIETATLKNGADKSEYFFRYGRVYEESGDYDKALEQYRYAIMAGNKRQEQFAARAALQMGKIYEHTGKPALALSSYKECLDMPQHDFQNSIDQQAKAGINRIEEK
jgi:tetratricopeptide (TPR) repeat protein